MMNLLLPLVFMNFLLVLGFDWVTQFIIFSLISLFFVQYCSFELVNYLVISNFLGGEVISYILCWLSVWIVMLMIISMLSKYKVDYFFILMNIMVVILFFVFMSLDLLMFYVSFEGVLIPTYILIVGWGYQPERLQAGVYLLFYTVLLSLPLLMFILWCEEKWGTLMFLYSIFVFESFGGLLFVLFGLLAFFVKMPMFLVHLWLPKAHVEAPIAGSMILAGVLLKMGGYGLFRMLKIFLPIMDKVGNVLMSVGILGGMLMSLGCLRQSDVK